MLVSILKVSRDLRHDLSAWDVSEVTDVSYLLCDATYFQQKLCWNISHVSESAQVAIFWQSGGSTDPSCVYECNAKADANAWAAVGCVVSGAVTGTKRSELGDGTFNPVANPTHTLTTHSTPPLSNPGSGVGILLNHLPRQRSRFRGQVETALGLHC